MVTVIHSYLLPCVRVFLGIMEQIASTLTIEQQRFINHFQQKKLINHHQTIAVNILLLAPYK